MLLTIRCGAEGPRKPVRIRRGPATVTGERTPENGHFSRGSGKAGVSEDPGARILAFRAKKSDRGEDPEKEVRAVENATKRVIGRGISPGDAPLWSWPTLAIILAILFAVLYGDGALLAPVLGEVAEKQNYLHEFFHDGRHLLGVPGH
jgi:hypothetical protein